MARIKKLSRKQIKDLKQQVKTSREKVILESDLSQEEIDQKIQSSTIKKDEKGLSREDRREITKKIQSLDKKNPTMTWNYEPGSLVKLPDGEIGLIVKNSAKDVEVKNHTYDMKKTIKQNRYSGKVFVVTSNGNNWYYPSQLKVVRD